MKVPNPLTAAKAAVRVVTELVQGNPVLVSEEVETARYNTCLACDRYDPSSTQCLECSCFVKLKISLSTESCPLNRWPE